MAQATDESKSSKDDVKVDIPAKIPAKMKGLVKSKEQAGFDYVDNLDVPSIEDDEVLVKAERVGICGSDIILYDWTKKAQLIAKVPFTPGHEVSGVVVKTGNKVKDLKIGSRVAIENHFYCGSDKCIQCRKNRGDICANMGQLGHGKGSTQGGCSQFFKVKGIYCYQLENSKTSWRDAALLEPLGVAVNAVNTAQVRENADEIVLVVGAGTIGCLAVNVCKAYKAAKIICIDVIDWKLEIAKKLGADIIVNATKFKSFEERLDFMMKETDGNGVGIIIECSGHAGTISNMFKYLRKGGTAVLVGLPKQDLVFSDPMPDIVFKAMTLKTIHGRRIFSTWKESERLISEGLIDCDAVVTDEIALSKYEDGYSKLKSGKALKIIFDVTK